MAVTVKAMSDEALEFNRRVLVLSEDRLSHYAEFRDFFVQRFTLDTVGFSTPGYMQGTFGRDYEFIFIGRNGQGFPSGVEIYALVNALEPMDDVAVDCDLWDILRWIFDEIGGDWSVEMLEATGRLYLIPAAMHS